MEPHIIGIKQLHKDLSKVARAASRGSTFLVLKYAKPMFRIEPMGSAASKKKYTLEDLLGLRFKFKTFDPNLSNKVDKIVYGI